MKKRALRKLLKEHNFTEVKDEEFDEKQETKGNYFAFSENGCSRNGSCQIITEKGMYYALDDDFSSEANDSYHIDVEPESYAIATLLGELFNTKTVKVKDVMALC